MLSKVYLLHFPAASLPHIGRCSSDAENGIRANEQDYKFVYDDLLYLENDSRYGRKRGNRMHDTPIYQTKHLNTRYSLEQFNLESSMVSVLV